MSNRKRSFAERKITDNRLTPFPDFVPCSITIAPAESKANLESGAKNNYLRPEQLILSLFPSTRLYSDKNAHRVTRCSSNALGRIVFSDVAKV